MSHNSNGTPLENKSASVTEISQAFNEFIHAFEEFKSTNDDRLDQIERRRSADVLTEEKLTRLNDALDQQQSVVDALTSKMNRPHLSGGELKGTATRQHKAHFDTYMRKGESHNLRTFEEKALSVASDPDGGYLVPEETESTILTSLSEVSPIRKIASIRQVSGAVYKKPVTVSGPGAGWVGETDPRPQTASPTLGELTFPTMELYAMPAATATLLDDAAVNVDEWLAEEVRTAFAEQESAAFVSGDGVNKPRGFLDYPTAADGTQAAGELGFIATGVDGAFSTSGPADTLLDTVYAVKAGYRANASWVMNRSTQAEIRKIKDADGNYIWQPSTSADGTPTLFSHPVVEAEDMSDIANGSTPIAFGDFRRGYLIVDRVGLRVLRDPYSSKPYVLFYTTKRVGGGVQDFDAIKLVKFAA